MTDPSGRTEVTVEPIPAGRFRVTVTSRRSETTHLVTVDPGMVPQGATRGELVVASFRFLLDREPQESILPEFDLRVISRYFPEYLDDIESYLG